MENDGVKVVPAPLESIPSLKGVLVDNMAWRNLFKEADGDLRCRMGEHAIEKFHASAVEVVHRLSYMSCATSFIAKETGLSVERVEEIAAMIETEKNKVIGNNVPPEEG
jgi:hypothetical protein